MTTTQRQLYRLSTNTQGRRGVVIRLIEGMKARGHRAYMPVNIEAVKATSRKLPENGVPPGIVNLLPLNEDLDNIQKYRKVQRLWKGMQTLLQWLRSLGTVLPTLWSWRRAVSTTPM